jgi:hypothetical protein
MATDAAVLPGSENMTLFAMLAARFPKDVIKYRKGGGQDLPYVTARTVMNRLDDVMGPENWWDDYQPIEDAVICRLTLRLPDGQIITKCDVGGNSKTQDASDVEKSGFSDAFKRAAVKFGVARYLYKDGVPDFVRGVLNGAEVNGSH